MFDNSVRFSRAEMEVNNPDEAGTTTGSNIARLPLPKIPAVVESVKKRLEIDSSDFCNTGVSMAGFEAAAVF